MAEPLSNDVNPFDQTDNQVNPFDTGEPVGTPAQAPETTTDSNPFDVAAPVPGQQDASGYGNTEAVPGSGVDVTPGSAQNQIDQLSYNWKQGYAGIARGLTVKKYNLWGQNPDTPEFKQSLREAMGERQQIEASMQGPDLTPAFDKEHWFGHLMGKSARMLPFMIESTLAGAQVATQSGPAFATGAAVMTPGPPQAKMAAAVPAFITGVSAGMKTGMVKYSAEVEGGRIYWDMLDRGIDPQTARTMSISAGVGIGLVEVFSDPVLSKVPGLKFINGADIFKNPIMKKVVGDPITKYLMDNGIEIGEEGVQQVIENAMNLAADAWDGKIPSGTKGRDYLDYMMKDVASSMTDAAKGLALITLPGGVNAISEKYSDFGFDKSVQELRKDVFEGKKQAVEPRDFRLAVSAQLEYLSKKKGSKADVDFIKQNIWDLDTIADKYGITLATEIDPGEKKVIRIIADGIQGNNQRASISSIEERPQDVVEMLPPQEGKQAPLPTHVQLPAVSEEQRATSRDAAISYLKDNPISVGPDSKATVNFSELNHVVQEALIREIAKAIEANPETQIGITHGDIQKPVEDFFKSINDTLFWEGGVPTEEGANHDVFWGLDKKTHKLSEMPALMALAKQDPKKATIIALRHPQQGGVVSGIRRLLLDQVRKTNTNLDPGITVADVDSSASIDKKPGSTDVSGGTIGETGQSVVQKSVHDYEYVDKSGNRLTSESKPDGAIYHGVQSYTIDKHGNLILKPTDHGIQFGINFSEQPLMAMYYAEMESTGQRKPAKGTKIVRISPEYDKSLNLVQQNYEELFSKNKRVVVPPGKYQIFEATEPKETSELRLMMSRFSGDDLVKGLVEAWNDLSAIGSHEVYEDEFVARFKAGTLSGTSDPNLVDQIITTLEAQGKLKRSEGGTQRVETPDVPKTPLQQMADKIKQNREGVLVISDPEVKRAFIEYQKAAKRKRRAQRQDYIDLEDATIAQDEAEIELRAALETSNISGIEYKKIWDSRNLTQTETGAAFGAVVGSGNSFQPRASQTAKSAYPKGVVGKSMPLTAQDMTVSKLNSLRRMSDEAGGLAHVPVRVLTGDDQVASDGTKMSTIMGQNQHFHAAGINKSRTAIYVQQTTLDARWQSYRERRGKGPVFDPSTAHEEWLVYQLPLGLTKEQFFQFAVEHERTHLATGLDGSKFDELATSIIALERLGLLDKADMMQSQMPFADSAKTVGKPFVSQVTEGVVDIPAKPVKPYNFTGVGFVDDQIQEKYSLHPEMSSQLHKDASKVMQVKADLGVDPELSQDEIQVMGVLDVVEDFIRRHNMEADLKDATIADVAHIVENMNEILRAELVGDIKKYAPHGQLRVSRAESPLVRSPKSAWEMTQRSDAKAPKSVWEIAGKEGDTQRPESGINEVSLVEAEMTQEELTAMNMKREHIERTRMFQSLVEQHEMAMEKSQRKVQTLQQEMDEIMAAGQAQQLDNSNDKEMTSRRKRLNAELRKIETLIARMASLRSEQSAVESYSQKEYQDFQASLPPGALDKVEIYFKRFQDAQDRQTQISEEVEQAQDQENPEVDLFDNPELIDPLEDFLGGIPSSQNVPSTSNNTGQIYPTVELGQFSKTLAFFKAINRMPWAIGMWGYNALEQMELKAKLKAYDKEFKPFAPNAVEPLVESQRAEQWFDMTGGLVHDKLEQAIVEAADKKHKRTPAGRSSASRKLQDAYSKIMTRAAEEIFGSGKPGVAHTSNIGVGGQHQTVEEGAAFVKGMQTAYQLLGRDVTPQHLQQWAQARPRRAYFNLLPPEIQNVLVYWVNEQKAWLDEQVKSGVYDAQNVYKLEQEGYLRRIAFKKHGQEEFGGPKRGTLGSEKESSRTEIRTFDEYYDKNASTMLSSMDNFPTLAGNYISESLRRLHRHRIIDMFSKMPGPRGINIVTYADEVVREGFASKANVQKFLFDNGYRQLKSGAGLAEHYNGGFKVPYVHNSVYHLYEDIRNERLSGSPVGKAWNKINYLAKRLITLIPHQFAAQTSFNSVLWSKDPLALPKWVGDLGSIYVKGPAEGARIISGDSKPYQSLKSNNYEAVKYSLLMKHGLPGGSFDWHMRAMFDKSIDSRHPQARPVLGNISEWFNTKGGLDKIAFENVISKHVYSLASVIYDREFERGWSAETAARRASIATGDMMQVLNNSTHGHEAAVLQALLFARDNTVAFLRQGTGALFPIWSKGHGFRTGSWSVFNSVLHGKTSKSDMYALSSIYASNIGKIIMWNSFATNMMQYAITQAYGDDEAKKNPWSWQNPGLNKFRVRLPWKQSGTQRWLYMDSMILREARYYYQTIIQGDWGKFVQNRLSWIPSAIVSANQGKDFFGYLYRNPAPLTLEEGLWNWFNTAKYLANSTVPNDLKGDNPTTFTYGQYLGSLGFPVYVGQPEQPGMSYRLTEEVRRREQNLQYYQDQLMRELKLHPENGMSLVLDGMTIDGKNIKMTPETYMAWVEREQAPQAESIKNYLSTKIKEAKMGLQRDDDQVMSAFHGDNE